MCGGENNMKKPLYKRELSHSYLVIDGLTEVELGKYQCQMILRNRIPGLLSCSERFLEGGACLYYDISSRQSLGRLYESTQIGYAGIRGIVDNLAQVQDTITEYLLEENRLVLEPEYIYMDLETEQLLFLYDPLGTIQERWGSIYLPVAEFLLEHVDHREEQAVTAAYQFYKMSKVESFTIESFRTILEKGRGIPKGETVYAVAEDWGSNYFHEEEGIYEYWGTQGRAAEGQDKWLDRSDDNNRTEEENPGLEDGDEIGKEGAGRKEWRIRYMAGLIGSFVIFFILCAAIWYLQPTESERICLFGLLAADGMLALWFLWKVVFAREPGRMPEERTEREENTEVGRNKSLSMEEENVDGLSGPTVFLGTMGRGGETDGRGRPRLVDMQEGGQEYSLDRLPVMVGKMRSRVQLLLPDASVSRIHARFVEKGGRTALIDLNSTNGTYVNGIRVEQEETVILEDGDAVTFGNIELTYRE